MSSSLPPPRSARPGFTLLELMIVLAIIAILATLLIPVYAQLRARAQKVACISNLRSLYVAAGTYLQREGHWPQIFLSQYESNQDYAKAWIAALAPCGIGRKNWICPTIQASLGGPDYTDLAHARIDYISTGFDDKAASPHQWPKQPWFVETGNVHGNGNLIIFTDGSIDELNNVAPK